MNMQEQAESRRICQNYLGRGAFVPSYACSPKLLLITLVDSDGYQGVEHLSDEYRLQYCNALKGLQPEKKTNLLASFLIHTDLFCLQGVLVLHTLQQNILMSDLALYWAISQKLYWIIGFIENKPQAIIDSSLIQKRKGSHFMEGIQRRNCCSLFLFQRVQLILYMQISAATLHKHVFTPRGRKTNHLQVQLWLGDHYFK